MTATSTDIAHAIATDTELDGFSRVHVAMVVTDPRLEDNPIVYVNDAFQRTTGFNRSAILGRNCRFLQGEDTDKRDVDAMRRAISEGRNVSVDILNYRSNGEAFTNRLIIAPIVDEAGTVKYFLGIQKELGDDERADAATEQAKQLEMVRARVQNDLSMLLRSIEEPDAEGAFEFMSLNRRLECLQLVYEEMRLLDSQITNAGLDLGALLSRVGSAITHEHSRSGIRYTQTIEQIEGNLETGVRVALLTSELLANAFQHAFDRTEQGFVELHVTNLAAGGLRITVTDDGIGMPSGQAFPDTSTRGGRLTNFLLDGLDATLNHVRGAAGSVFIIDVPLGD